MPVAHGWKGLSLNVSAVYLAGRQGRLWARWQCYQNHWRGCWHLWFKEGVDLKRNFFHLVVGTFLRTEMTNVKQSTVFATCAVSSWFVGALRVWSNTVLNRSVCGEESSLMSIEGVPPTALWDCLCCEAIEREEKLTIPASRIDIYLKQQASSSVLPIRCKWGWNLPAKSYCFLRFF